MLHPACAFTFGTQAFTEYEGARVGVTSKTWNVSNKNNVTFQVLIYDWFFQHITPSMLLVTNPSYSHPLHIISFSFLPWLTDFLSWPLSHDLWVIHLTCSALIFSVLIYLPTRTASTWWSSMPSGWESWHGTLPKYSPPNLVPTNHGIFCFYLRIGWNVWGWRKTTMQGNAFLRVPIWWMPTTSTCRRWNQFQTISHVRWIIPFYQSRIFKPSLDSQSMLSPSYDHHLLPLYFWHCSNTRLNPDNFNFKYQPRMMSTVTLSCSVFYHFI